MRCSSIPIRISDVPCFSSLAVISGMIRPCRQQAKMLLSHLGYPANVFIFFGLTFFATPCLAALIVDPSCNQYSREVYQAIADVQAVTDKAYRRLLAIKTGDIKAAATYKVFFGKDGNPEAKLGWCSSKTALSDSIQLIARLDTTAWQRHFLGWHQLEPEYFIHPGRVVGMYASSSSRSSCGRARLTHHRRLRSDAAPEG